MEGLIGTREPLVIGVSDSSQVYDARRKALSLAAEQNWDETSAGKLAILATEISTNLVKHARMGEMLIGACHRSGQNGIEILAFDRGPGIEHVDECLRDGFSSTGTAGAGLGAIARLADEFDIYSQIGKGTSLVARLYPPSNGHVEPNNGSAVQVATAQMPVRGERECGDNWGWRVAQDRTIVILADGLGHGPEAAKASLAAIKVLESATIFTPAALLERIHRLLQPTRGAAVAVASIDPNGNQLQFAGVGNISAVIIQPGACQHLVSHNGTAGHNVRKIQEFTYKWPQNAVLVMHSDGITTHWRTDAYPGLVQHHAALLAATLLRDESRGRDDACVLVARNAK